MNVGDKKQAAILSVVAVLAVGFLISQVKGKASAGVSPGSTSAVAIKTESPSPLAEPVKVLGDPFSNPILGKLVSDKKATGSAPPPKKSDRTKNSRHIPPYPVPDPMPGAMPDGPPGTGSDMTSLPKGGPTSVESTRPSVVLNAIVSAGHPIALISVNGGQNRQFSAGQTVAAGIRIRSIGDDAISLSVTGHKGPITLTVGSKF